MKEYALLALVALPAKRSTASPRAGPHAIEAFCESIRLEAEAASGTSPKPKPVTLARGRYPAFSKVKDRGCAVFFMMILTTPPTASPP